MKHRLTFKWSLKALGLVVGAVFAATMILAAAFDPGGLSPAIIAGNLFSAIVIAISALGCLALLCGVEGALSRLDASRSVRRRNSSSEHAIYTGDSIWND